MDLPASNDNRSSGDLKEGLKRAIVRQLEALEERVKNDRSPFPYEDVDQLMRITGNDVSELSADLNAFCMDISGFSSWGKSALDWSDAEIDNIESVMKKGFFEVHPHYRPIEYDIDRLGLSALKKLLLTSDSLRCSLLRILADLRQLKRRTS